MTLCDNGHASLWGNVAMFAQNLPYDHIDPDSDITDLKKVRRRAEYRALALVVLFTVPWVFGLIAIAKAVSRLFHR